MTEPWVLSASQYKTFAECQRKWGWDKIEGIKQPEKLSTAFGKEVHRILEDYLRDGTSPNRHTPWTFDGKTLYPGATARTMIGPHLCKPGVGTVEGEFKWHDKENDIHWRGFIDHIAVMYDVPPSFMPGYYGGGTLLRVTDHKTSVDPTKYGLSEDTLLEDPQRILYGHAWWRKTEGVGEYVWNYGARDASPSKAYVVRVVEHSGVTAERYRLMVPKAKELLDAKANVTNVLELPPNPSACNMYGGCPHKQRCNLTDEQKIGALVMGNSLIDELLGETETETETETEPKPEPEAEKPKAKPKPKAKRQPKASAKDMVNPPETEREPTPEPKGTMDRYDEAMAEAIACLVMEKLAAKLGAK